MLLAQYSRSSIHATHRAIAYCSGTLRAGALSPSLRAPILVFYWDWENVTCPPLRSLIGVTHTVTVAAGETRPWGLPPSTTGLYNSGTSDASCSETSPNGIPVQLGRRCAVSGAKATVMPTPYLNRICVAHS